jgi:hypothetical protein
MSFNTDKPNSQGKIAYIRRNYGFLACFEGIYRRKIQTQRDNDPGFLFIPAYGLDVFIFFKVFFKGVMQKKIAH